MSKKLKSIVGSGAIATLGVGLLATQVTFAETQTNTNEEPVVDAVAWEARSVQQVESGVSQYENLDDLGAYQVMWGDTLWAISQAIGYSVDDITSAFGISNPDLIYADLRLDQQIDLQPRDSKVPSGADAGEVQDTVEEYGEAEYKENKENSAKNGMTREEYYNNDDIQDLNDIEFEDDEDIDWNHFDHLDEDGVPVEADENREDTTDEDDNEEEMTREEYYNNDDIQDLNDIEFEDDEDIDWNHFDHLDEDGVPVEADENREGTIYEDDTDEEERDMRTIPEKFEDGDLTKDDLPPDAVGVTKDGQPVRDPELVE